MQAEAPITSRDYRVDNFGWCICAMEHGLGTHVIARLETGRTSESFKVPPTPEQLAELDRMVIDQRARWAALSAEA